MCKVNLVQITDTVGDPDKTMFFAEWIIFLIHLTPQNPKMLC